MVSPLTITLQRIKHYRGKLIRYFVLIACLVFSTILLRLGKINSIILLQIDRLVEYVCIILRFQYIQRSSRLISEKPSFLGKRLFGL